MDTPLAPALDPALVAARRADAWTKLRTTRRGTFDLHYIVESVESPTFGSWLIRARKRGEFWCRISAGHGFVSVFGDFGPCTFAYGPRDPVGCLCWVAGMDGGYFKSKAVIGSGRHAAIESKVEFALEDLAEMIADHRNEDDDDEHRESYLRILTAGQDASTDYDGEPGVVEVIEAMEDANSDEGGRYDVIEMLPDAFGQRLRPCFSLARDAIRRLVWLLD